MTRSPARPPPNPTGISRVWDALNVVASIGGMAALAGTVDNPTTPSDTAAVTAASVPMLFRRMLPPLAGPRRGIDATSLLPTARPRQNAEKGPRGAPSLRLPLDGLGGDASQCALSGRAGCVRDRSLETDALDGVHRTRQAVRAAAHRGELRRRGCAECGRVDGEKDRRVARVVQLVGISAGTDSTVDGLHAEERTDALNRCGERVGEGVAAGEQDGVEVGQAEARERGIRWVTRGVLHHSHSSGDAVST